MKDIEVSRKSQRASPDNYRDSISRTLGKTWKSFISEAILELIPSGAGFAVGLVGSPMVGAAIELAVNRVLEYTLHRFTHIYEAGEITLSEVFGRTIPDKRYQRVSDFWAKLVKDKLEPGALIEISGLLSPYGPLMPAHPMSRPGYTVEGWEALGDLNAKSTEEYDTRDGFIYGDRVIRLSAPRHNKYYAGLYDPYFGISNISIPLYVDRKAFKSSRINLETLWQHPMDAGKIAKVKGRLKQIPNFYSQFTDQLPEQYCTLPSFGLEVFEIEKVAEPDGITHMAVTVSWKKRDEERMITHYFNVQEQNQFAAVEKLLGGERERHSKSLLFNYDDLACFSPAWRFRIPEYNEMLRPWLEGEDL